MKESKNIVFIPLINKGNNSTRHYGYEYAVKAWEKWCEKFNARLVVWTEPICSPQEMTIPWQRYFVLDILDANHIEYENIALVDADIMPLPKANNFFEIIDKEKFNVVANVGDMEWLVRSIQGYRQAFNEFKDIELEPDFCYNGGFQVFNKKFKYFLDIIKKFYLDNKEKLIECQTTTIRLGTDQTPVNYLALLHHVPLNFLPLSYNLQDCYRKNLLYCEPYHWWGDNLDNLYSFGKFVHLNAILKNSMNRNHSYWLKRIFEECYEK